MVYLLLTSVKGRFQLAVAQPSAKYRFLVRSSVAPVAVFRPQARWLMHDTMTDKAHLLMIPRCATQGEDALLAERIFPCHDRRNDKTL